MSIMLPSSRPLPCLTSGGNLPSRRLEPILVRGHSMKQKQKKCNFLECPPSPPTTSVFTPPCSSQKVTSNVFCTRKQSITEPRVNPVHSGANQEDIPISHPPPLPPFCFGLWCKQKCWLFPDGRRSIQATPSSPCSPCSSTLGLIVYRSRLNLKVL